MTILTGQAIMSLILMMSEKRQDSKLWTNNMEDIQPIIIGRIMLEPLFSEDGNKPLWMFPHFSI